MEIKIRKEELFDYQAVYELTVDAFGRVTEAELVARLRDSGNFIPALSLVAVHRGQIIGHVLFTPVKIENSGHRYESIALAPLSVMPEYQRSGIGKKLTEEGIAAAKELGFESVIVLGHAEYYHKFGFRPASKWNIKTSYDVPDDVFMALELKPGALDNISGMVVYPAEFDEV